MLVREMHIEFDLKCQKLDSNHYDTFLAEEKDWLLNLAQHQVIKTRSTRKSNRKQEGFFDTYKRVEDLEELVTSAALPVYTLDPSNKDTGFAILPANFFGMVNHRVGVQYNCNGLATTDTAALHKFAKVTVAESVPTPPIKPFQGLSIVLNTTGAPITLFTESVVIPSHLTVKEQRYYIIALIVEEINRGTSGVKVYWNKYLSSVNNQQLIFTSTDATHVSIAFTLHTGALTAVTNLTNSGFKTLGTSSTAKRAYKNAARVADNEFVYKMQDNPFHSSKHNSVLLTYENGTIVVHQNATFYAENVYVDYIRRPQLINLALHRDCELSDKIHDEIVDKAVLLAQAYIGTETYKTIINESLLNE